MASHIPSQLSHNCDFSPMNNTFVESSVFLWVWWYSKSTPTRYFSHLADTSARRRAFCARAHPSIVKFRFLGLPNYTQPWTTGFKLAYVLARASDGTEVLTNGMLHNIYHRFKVGPSSESVHTKGRFGRSGIPTTYTHLPSLCAWHQALTFCWGG